MIDLPEPLTNTSHDVAGLDGFMLNTDKLMASELWALATGEEFKAAVGLWCRAWKQVPAGSLPSDDRILAAFSGAGVRWVKIKEVALRGFVLCSDSRLYNKTLCEDVHRAAASKALRQERTKAATEARKTKRDVQRDDAPTKERDVDQDPNVTKSHRQDRTIQESKKEGGVGSAREISENLEARLREAAGWQREPSPQLFVTGQIEGLIANGADLELDVLPTVRAIAPQARSRTSWKYFVGAIARARDDRIAASTLVSPPQNGRNANGKHSNGAQRIKSKTELIFETLPRGHGQGDPDVWDQSDPGNPANPVD